MAFILKTIYQSYYWIFDELADHRSDDWFLMQGPWQPAAIMIGYLYFVFKIGPAFMKNRPAYDLKHTLIIFNIIQILLNGYIFVNGAHMAFETSWICAEVDYSDSPKSRLQLNLTYIYFLMKISDLLDTVFFILRKKTSQVSFLHVYHHFGMIFLSWTGTKFLAGGHGLFLGLFNIVVHMVMYLYYLISAWDAKYKHSIWFKKQITHLQMLQFTALIIMFGGLLVQPNCNYPKFAAAVFVVQNLFMLVLFGDFYYKAYIKKKTNINGDIKQQQQVKKDS